VIPFGAISSAEADKSTPGEFCDSVPAADSPICANELLTSVPPAIVLIGWFTVRLPAVV
jgi:hypothetical protein